MEKSEWQKFIPQVGEIFQTLAAERTALELTELLNASGI